MKSTRAFRMVCVSSGISLACVTACNGQTSTSTSDNTGFGNDDGGGGSSGGSSGGVSSNGGNGGGSSSGSAPGYVDGGISCGVQGGCATSESCCYSTATGAGGFPAGPTCAASGSCSGSSLDCSSTTHCSGSQVCCFAFAPMDAGAGQGAGQSEAGGGVGGFGGFGGFGAPAPAQGFSAQCADQCPSGDMVHYQLCATSSECPSGQNCVPGQYTTYCAAGGMNGFPGGPGSDASMGAPSSD
jgi:hypothetical protein